MFYGDGTFSSSGPGEPGSVKRTCGRPFLIGSASDRRTSRVCTQCMRCEALARQKQRAMKG